MPIARTLSGYIARQFLTWFGAVFGTMISIAFLLDYIELIRRSGTRDQGNWGGPVGKGAALRLAGSGNVGRAAGNGGAQAAAHRAGRDAVRDPVRDNAGVLAPDTQQR